MIELVIAFLVSIVPSVLIILWLRRRRKEDLRYRKSVSAAARRGFLSVLPILCASAAFALISAFLRFMVLQDANPLVYQAIYTFIVLAFAEEATKYLTLQYHLRKEAAPWSWADVVAFMVVIGTAFGLIEDIAYAIGATPIVMLVRGVTMGHVGYGFIMGWFYGKGLYTGKAIYRVLAFLVPFALHGLYDFSLSPELLAVSEDFAVIAVSLAFVDLVLVVLTIRFFIRARRKDRYNEPIASLESPASPNRGA